MTRRSNSYLDIEARMILEVDTIAIIASHHSTSLHNKNKSIDQNIRNREECKAEITWQSIVPENPKPSKLMRPRIFAAGRESKIDFVSAAAHDHNDDIR